MSMVSFSVCGFFKRATWQHCNYLTCGEPKDNQGLNSVTATEFPIDVILSLFFYSIPYRNAMHTPLLPVSLILSCEHTKK